MGKQYKWSEEEDLLIKSLLSQNKTNKEITNFFPNASIISVKNRINKLANRSHKSSIWTEELIKQLENNCANMTVKELSNLLQIKEASIYAKLNALGLEPKFQVHSWTEEEDTFIKDNFYKLTYTRIGKKLNRSTSSVQQRAVKLGLKKISKLWQSDQIKYLKDIYADTDTDELISIFNRSAAAIHNKAYELGLSKNNSILTEKEKLYITANCGSKTDVELALMFKCSSDTIKYIRHSNKIYKDGTEVKGSTYIEQFIKSFLEENNISFIFNQPLGTVKPDFQIENTKFIIEVQGDYWHCNPKLYPNGPKDLIQMQHVLRDYVKKCYYVSNNYVVLYIWEDDIKNHPEQVKSEVLELILPSPKVI